jgi:hypothetical protein
MCGILGWLDSAWVGDAECIGTAVDLLAHRTLNFNPLPMDNPRQRQPDIALAKGKLGCEQKVLLEDSLEETTTSFRKNT